MKNKKIISLILILMIFSLINNYFAKYMLSAYENYFIKELVWCVISLSILFIMSKINLNFIFKNSIYLYILGIILLLVTLFYGVEVNGAKSWLNILGFTFQPSEFMKVFLILYLREFTINNQKISDFKYILITGIIVLIPSLLTFLEPDTGGLLIYLIIYIVFLIMKNLNKWWYIGVTLTACFSVIIFIFLFYEYQNIFIKIFGSSFFYRMDRITNFVSNEGYQINQALKSIGASGFFGIKKKIYFPEAPTDFAFTFLISNIGFIGIIFFLFIYYQFLTKILNSKYDIYLKYPVFSIIFIQYTINILMNIGLLPIIGIPLPFLSYGGSNLISYMLLIGILINYKSNDKD